MSEAILQNILNTFDQYYERKQQNKVNKVKQENADRDFTQKQTEFNQQQKNQDLQFQVMAAQAKQSQALQKMQFLQEEQKHFNTTGNLSANMTKVRDGYQQSGPNVDFGGDFGAQTKVQDPSNPNNSTIAGAVMDHFRPMSPDGSIIAQNKELGVEGRFIDPVVNAENTAQLKMIADEPILRRDEARQVAMFDKQFKLNEQQNTARQASEEQRQKAEAEKFEKANDNRLAIEELRQRHADDRALQQQETSMARISAQIAMSQNRSDASERAKALKISERAISPRLQNEISKFQDIMAEAANLQSIIDDPAKLKALTQVFPKAGFFNPVAQAAQQAQHGLGWISDSDNLDIRAAAGKFSATGIKETYGAVLSREEAPRAKQWAVNIGTDTFEELKAKVKLMKEFGMRGLTNRMVLLSPAQRSALSDSAVAYQGEKESTRKNNPRTGVGSMEPID